MGSWENNLIGTLDGGSEDFETPTVCLQSSTGDFYIGGSYESVSGSYPAGDFCLIKLSNSGDLLWKQINGDFLYGEAIVDMELNVGVNSNESIIACGFQMFNGNFSTLNCWLGRYDTVELTSSSTSYSGMIISSSALGALGILILTQYKKKKRT
jgi:hypothetical protein